MGVHWAVRAAQRPYSANATRRFAERARRAGARPGRKGPHLDDPTDVVARWADHSIETRLK
jgi:hypothetical protein